VGSRQEDIICGMLLGDGFLERNGRYLRLVADHGSSQTNYVRWLADQLVVFKPSLLFKRRLDSRTQKTYGHCILRTRTSPKLEKFFDLFYERGRKRIPPLLKELISPMILAVWIMDDGYKRNDCHALRLNTQGYTWEEQEIIKLALNQMGIKANIHKQKKYHLVYIPSCSMDKLIGIIKPFVVPSMEYKLGLTP